MSRQPLWKVKGELVYEFRKWAEERDVALSAGNMIEFLIQKRFLKGKQFNDFIDQIQGWHPWESMEVRMEYGHLQEGFLLPDTYIGRKKNKDGKRKDQESDQADNQKGE